MKSQVQIQGIKHEIFFKNVNSIKTKSQVNDMGFKCSQMGNTYFYTYIPIQTSA